MGTKVPPDTHPKLLILRSLGHTQVTLRLGQGLCFSAVHKHLLGERGVPGSWVGRMLHQSAFDILQSKPGLQLDSY